MLPMPALLLLASLFASASQPPGRPVADSVQTRLQQLADSVVAARPRMPGIIIAVEQPATGKRWSVAAGLADTARRIGLTPDQPVRLASNTKTYTAAAVLRLMEMGRLSLSDPLATHLPQSVDSLLRRDGYATDIITIEQVLNHRAGLNEHPAVRSYIAKLRTDPLHHWTPREQLQWLVDSLAPVGPPGAQFRYSDDGYVLLGLIVERYTGQSLGPAVRSLVRFDKLGLRHTWWETLEPAPPGEPDRAHQYLGGFDAYGIDPSFDHYADGGPRAFSHRAAGRTGVREARDARNHDAAAEPGDERLWHGPLRLNGGGPDWVRPQRLLGNDRDGVPGRGGDDRGSHH